MRIGAMIGADGTKDPIADVVRLGKRLKPRAWTMFGSPIYFLMMP